MPAAMADSREVRCYDYVPVRFERVRELLRSDGVTIFSRATATANERARALVATLRMNVGAVEVGVDVQLRVKGITDETDATAGHRIAEATVLRLLRDVRAQMMSELGVGP